MLARIDPIERVVALSGAGQSISVELTEG
jgi:hypothetical protein